MNSLSPQRQQQEMLAASSCPCSMSSGILKIPSFTSCRRYMDSPSENCNEMYQEDKDIKEEDKVVDSDKHELETENYHETNVQDIDDYENGTSKTKACLKDKHVGGMDDSNKGSAESKFCLKDAVKLDLDSDFSGMDEVGGAENKVTEDSSKVTDHSEEENCGQNDEIGNNEGHWFEKPEKVDVKDVNDGDSDKTDEDTTNRVISESKKKMLLMSPRTKGDVGTDEGNTNKVKSERNVQSSANDMTRIKNGEKMISVVKNPPVQYLRAWLNETKDSCKTLNLLGVCNKTSKAYKKGNAHKKEYKNNDNENVMKFAEILYKCTLCTTIPSIMTSKQSFIDHVNKLHLSQGDQPHSCGSCSLQFQTIEDLKEHMMFSHTGSDISISCDIEGSDVTDFHGNTNEDHESVNDSDSDSSGHRQFRAKIVKRSKPSHDFQNPKQLVDHTGIETLNGSLDLTKKGEVVNETLATFNAASSKTKERCDIDIKKITDQIAKSDVQGRSRSKDPDNKFPFTPASTAEFGKFTKLVREGGNIVYFCQICNWKSPIKSTFQAHCNLASHKRRVLNPESTLSDKDEGLNENVENSGVPKNPCISSQILSQSNNPYLYSQAYNQNPRKPEPSLFHKYIVHSKSAPFNHKIKTPVVSPYGNSSCTVFENARHNTKRPSECPVDMVIKKRKRFTRNPLNDQTADSESEDDGKTTNQHQNSPAPTSSIMAFLRNKLLGKFTNKGDISLQNEKSRNTNSPENKAIESDADNKKRDCVASDRPLNCHACSFQYHRIDEYEKHFDRVHKSMLWNMLQTSSPGPDHQSSPSLMRGSPDYSCPIGYQRNCSQLFESKMETEGSGNDGRRGSPTGKTALENGTCETGENWRVHKLKELFPECPTTVQTFPMDNESLFHLPPREAQLLSSSRELNADTERIVEHLPTVVQWTGCMETGVYRQELLLVLGASPGEQAYHWGSQCNRAIRLVFPLILKKRKGSQFPFQDHPSEQINHSPGEMYKLGKKHQTLKDLLTKGSNSKDFVSFSENIVTCPSKRDLETVSEKTEIDLSQSISESVRQDAVKEMDDYLVKFGGISSSLPSPEKKTSPSPENRLQLSPVERNLPSLGTELSRSPAGLNTQDQENDGDDESSMSIDVEF
ncbi:hypothetical protein MAR_033518 [Mya arenaria]|uniref:C2H2-type domain-containing protein n=1 Tax=Mya arenaria TaxID=6604 RepID=A0ABY7GDE1_MYAAR|nr:hypothetical protein MAR_033518 [Mya arenaria]